MLVLRRRLRFVCPPLRKAMRCVCATEIVSWSLFTAQVFFAVRSASRVGHFFARPQRAGFRCSNILLVLRRRLRFFCPPLRKAMRCVYATEIASWGLRRSYFSAVRSASREGHFFARPPGPLSLGVRIFCSCCAAGLDFLPSPSKGDALRLRY